LFTPDDLSDELGWNRFQIKLLGDYDEAQDCGDRYCDQAGTQEGLPAGGQGHKHSFGDGIRGTTACEIGQLELGFRAQYAMENRQKLLKQRYRLLTELSRGQVIPTDCKIIFPAATPPSTHSIAAGSPRFRVLLLVCEGRLIFRPFDYPGSGKSRSADYLTRVELCRAKIILVILLYTI
jgi:hypothetical protein